MVKIIDNGRDSWEDYLLLFLIIALTGFEFCFNYAPGIFFLVGPLSVYMCIRRRRYPNLRILSFCLILLAWCIFQVITGQSLKSALQNFYLRFIIYIFAALSINKFEKVFFNIIYFLALISIPLWLINDFIPGGRQILLSIFPNISIPGCGLDPRVSSNPNAVSIGLYLVTDGGIRNCGPFWEPGMFSLFLDIAYLFYILRTHRPFDRKAIIILIAIFSTFSTTGYIACFAILVWYYIFIDFSPKSIIFLPIIMVGVLYFLNSDFGLEKINHIAQRKESDSRFAAVLYHFALLKDVWYVGRGFASSNRNGIEVSPNGISLVFLFWGVLFALYYYYLLFISSKKIARELTFSKKVSNIIITFFTLIIVIFSQDVSTRHFYYFLLMYGLVPIHRRIKYVDI